MLTKSFIAAGALLSMVAAVPLQKQDKRDIVWETKIENEFVTVDVTTTVWLEPGETAPAVPNHYHGHNYGHHHNKPKITSHIKSTVTVPAASPSSPVESAPASTYVAPVPSTSAAPESPSSPYQAPTPTSTYQAPAPTSEAPAPASSAPSGGSGGGAPSGQTYTGDITYYTPGLGSCGTTSTESEAIVALPEAMMEAVDPPNPNDNPYCGKMITISYDGKQTQAKVVDTCPGCSGGSIDLSPSLFKTVAPNGDGRVSGVEWWFD